MLDSLDGIFYGGFEVLVLRSSNSRRAGSSDSAFLPKLATAPAGPPPHKIVVILQQLGDGRQILGVVGIQSSQVLRLPAAHSRVRARKGLPVTTAQVGNFDRHEPDGAPQELRKRIVHWATFLAIGFVVAYAFH